MSEKVFYNFPKFPKFPLISLNTTFLSGFLFFWGGVNIIIRPSYMVFVYFMRLHYSVLLLFSLQGNIRDLF